jgi:hypothetical protein
MIYDWQMKGGREKIQHEAWLAHPFMMPFVVSLDVVFIHSNHSGTSFKDLTSKIYM